MRSSLRKIKLLTLLLFIIYVATRDSGVAQMDAAHPWQVGFQDPATPIMEGIIFFNGLLMTFMLFIACFVGWLLYQSLTLFDEAEHAEPASFNHSTLLEVVWTIIPAGILMVISVPSYNLLYAMEEVIDPSLTIKVVGHQWYWSYECSDINFDSYLIADDDLAIPEVSGTGKAGKVFRLLEVDNRLFVPTNTHIRVLVTSADVLHSWAVPSLGVKVDACPGRLNQVFLFVKREGVFYGQCSELCGVNHGFMPIVVQAVSQDDYLTWVGKRLCS
uniref:cytochrome oxidase subunit II n=1 Tax=Halosiphon tomentosus TaxID=64927 RepID=UPI002E7A45C6|nr:cytochrome oxidase subunit II [Halosiphon tomentosus]WBP70137.1 cytochrome oxidase subunit II [Halosiphon tomentosus]